MKLKKLSKFKDNLAVPKVQYSSRRFSNKAYDTLGYSYTSAAPYYLTTRTADQLDYLTQYLRTETGLQYNLPTYMHAAAPEEYGNYGYHHIMNMGLNLPQPTLFGGSIFDHFKNGAGGFDSKLREARARLLLNYDFKKPGSLITKKTSRVAPKEFVDTFETPTIFRKYFRTKRAWDLFEHSKKIGGRLELRDISKTASSFLKPVVSIYSDLLEQTSSFEYGNWVQTGLSGIVEPVPNSLNPGSAQLKEYSSVWNRQSSDYFEFDFTFDSNLEQTQGSITDLKISTISNTYFPVKFSTLIGRLNFQVTEKLALVHLKMLDAQKTLRAMTKRKSTHYP